MVCQAGCRDATKYFGRCKTVDSYTHDKAGLVLRMNVFDEYAR
ncbi:MAG: hypothetical protein Q4C09_07635 [Atopobiaceae bacterium]|nr:hypothetical protein [Atopobiaceae bacterium]